MKEIKFETKFDLGETAFRFNPNNNKLEEFIIEKISFDITKDNIYLMYGNGSQFLLAEQLFRSKQEFIDGL
jgi:hypothetical protein